jgi:signal transduction histidine kinase
MTELVIESVKACSTTAKGPSGSDAEALRRRLRRLAFDVHDGPMQSLVVIAYGLRELQQTLRGHLGSAEHGAVTAQIDLMTSELATSEAALRTLLTSLEAGGVAEADLLDEIAAAELARFSRRCDAATEMIVQPDFLPDSHSQAVAIGAILREALNNIAKHANASEVLVCLQADEREILLEVRDNGDGFDPTAVAADSIGLSSMRERLSFLDGDLRITSKTGGPTVVTAIFRRWKPPVHSPD